MATTMAVGFGVAVHAADDLPPEISIPEISATSSATGWYLRADVGYAAWTGDEEPGYRIYGAGGSADGIDEFDNARFSNPLSVGAGVGYQFTDIVRADVMVETFKDRFSGDTDFGGPCIGGAGAQACGARHDADYRGVSILANGYVDLATIAGFTPYIGAGAGATHMKWGNLTSNFYCATGEVSCAGSGSGEYGGIDSWRFTYALMAGVSYDISNRVKLDLGYRYSDIDGGDMFGYGAAENGIGSAKGRDDGLSRHEFRAGLRVSLW